MEKKTYSINLAAAVMCQTHILPEVRLDDTTNTYYCVFPPCHGVEAAIRAFRTDSRLELNIRQFLDAIKYIRTAMSMR